MTGRTVCWCGKPVVGRGLCNTHHHALRARLVAYGKWEPDQLPSGPVLERIAQIREAGIGFPRMGELMGVHQRTLQGIVYDQRKTIRRRTYDAVMSFPVQDIWRVAADYASVDAVGTMRRLRALAAIGHRRCDVNTRLGLDRSGLSHVVSGQHPRISAKRARDVATLFEELWEIPGPCDATRRMAARKGWLPPMAWTDIDDPNEVPDLSEPRVRSAELIRELEEIIGIRSDDLIAKELGIETDSVKRERSRMNARAREAAQRELQDAS